MFSMNYSHELRPFRERVIHLLKDIGFFKGVIYKEEAGCRSMTLYGFWRIETWEEEGKIMHRALRRRADDYRLWEEVPIQKDFNRVRKQHTSPSLGAPLPDMPFGSALLFYRGDCPYFFQEAINIALNNAMLISGYGLMFPEISPNFNFYDAYLYQMYRRDEQAIEEYQARSVCTRKAVSFGERARAGEISWPSAYRLSVCSSIGRLMDNNRRGIIHYRLFLKYFWHSMVDRPLYRVVCLTRQGTPNLNAYLAFARNREAAVSLLQEKPNLIPFLNFLPIEEWGRPDVLAARRWVRSLKTTRKTQLSFASPGAYRLMQRLSPKAVTCICSSARYRNDIPRFMESLLQAQIAPRLPFQLIQILSNRLKWWDINFLSPLMLRLIGRQFLRLKGSRRQVSRIELGTFERDINWIKDWMDTTGYQPEKNSTWNGLLRRARTWHEAPEGSWEEILKESSTKAGWDDPLGAEDRIIAGKCTVRPLLSPASLIQEGMEMEHCLKWDQWRQACEGGDMWCYSLTWNDTLERSTVAIAGRDGLFDINQHYGKRNATPGEQLQRAALILLGMFRQSWERREKSSHHAGASPAGA